MVFKKIRKGITLFGLIIGVLIVIGFFIIMFDYLNYNANDSGVTLSDNYGNVTKNLMDSQNGLDALQKNITAGLNQVVEPKEGIFSVLNGLMGLASVFRLPLVLIVIVKDAFVSMSSIVSQNTGISNEIIILASTGLIIFTLFIIWSVMKGDQQKII